MGGSATKKTDDYAQTAGTAPQPKRYRRPQLAPSVGIEEPLKPERLAKQPEAEPASESLHYAARQAVQSTQTKQRPIAQADRWFGIVAVLVVFAVNVLLFWVLHASPPSSSEPLDLVRANAAPAQQERIIEYRRAITP